MEEITLWFKISAGLFGGFVIALIYGLAAGKSKAIWASLIVLGVSLCAGGYTAYVFVTKSYHRIKDLADEQKKDKDTYNRIFGKSDNFCLQIRSHGASDGSEDGGVRVESEVVGLHFYTCPEEMQRILGHGTHTAAIVSAYSMHEDFYPSWFQPSTFGDSIWVFSRVSNTEEGTSSHTIYSSLDSTQAYYIGIYRETTSF